MENIVGNSFKNIQFYSLFFTDVVLSRGGGTSPSSSYLFSLNLLLL